MADRAITPAQLDVTDATTTRRANVRSMVDDAAASRLLADAGRPDLAEPVTRTAARRLRRVLAGLATAVVLTAALTPLGAPSAQARVLQPAPLRAVLAGPTAAVRLSVVATVPTTAHGGFGIIVGVPSRRYGSIEGEAWADGPVIDATVTLDSTDVQLGAQRWEVEDLGDGTVTSVPVTVLRASKVTPGSIVALGGGRVAGVVGVRHYDPATGAYRASQQSPVRVEVLQAGRWTAVASWTSGADGTAGGVVALPAGVQRIRFTRPDGATVANATSGAVAVHVI